MSAFPPPPFPFYCCFRFVYSLPPFSFNNYRFLLLLLPPVVVIAYRFLVCSSCTAQAFHLTVVPRCISPSHFSFTYLFIVLSFLSPSSFRFCLSFTPHYYFLVSPGSARGIFTMEERWAGTFSSAPIFLVFYFSVYLSYVVLSLLPISTCFTLF